MLSGEFHHRHLGLHSTAKSTVCFKIHSQRQSANSLEAGVFRHHFFSVFRDYSWALNYLVFFLEIQKSRFMIALIIQSYEGNLQVDSDCPKLSKEIQLVHSKGDQPWVFIGKTEAKAETPILWSPHAKSWLIGKDSDAGRDWGQEEKGMTEGMTEMAGWHHQLDGREFEWTPGVGDGQGGLACCSTWGQKELDMTEWLNWLTDCIIISV